MPPLAAEWFDGRSSAARAVLVHLEPGRGGPRLRLTDTAGAELLALGPTEVEWPERWGARSRGRLTVDLRAHGSLQVEEADAWFEALQRSGHRPGLAQQMQARWGTLAAVLLLAIAALGAFYRWGTPWAATQLARHVPLQWELALAERAMLDIDGTWTKPSRLPAERQQALRREFDALAASIPPQLRQDPRYAPPLRLHFRSGLGANAFALPGGTIVLTDGMVEAAARQGLGDDALVGVLAHEIGHVLGRHTTRMVAEQAVLNVGLGLALGDVSTLLSSGASLLTGLAYRRGHETEADCFAIAVMRAAGRPTKPMADLLLAVEAEAHGSGSRSTPTWAELLSSHPATPERARALQAGDDSACNLR